MSVALMGEVFRRYPHGGNEMLLALSLADHAHDDGTRIFPSVDHLARKIRVSDRTVQTLLRKMMDEGWLLLVRDSSGGRGQTRHYRINPAWVNGEDISPLQDNAGPGSAPINGEKVSPLGSGNGEEVSPFGNTHKPETVKTEVRNGEAATSPEPSEPSVVSSYELPTGDCRKQDEPEGKGGIRWDAERGIFVGIPESQMQTWEEAFSPVDVDAELTQMELWWQANPRKRKRNITRFITGWLRRELQGRKHNASRPAPARHMRM